MLFTDTVSVVTYKVINVVNSYKKRIDNIQIKG